MGEQRPQYKKIFREKRVKFEHRHIYSKRNRINRKRNRVKIKEKKKAGAIDPLDAATGNTLKKGKNKEKGKK